MADRIEDQITRQRVAIPAEELFGSSAGVRRSVSDPLRRVDEAGRRVATSHLPAVMRDRSRDKSCLDHDIAMLLGNQGIG